MMTKSRSGLRRLARMARLLIKYRDPAWVTRGESGWIQRYRDGTIVTPTLAGPPYRILEAATIDLFFYDYRPTTGETIIELGAEFGTETLFLSRAVGPTGRVIAVEAHPRTCAGLREMIRLNNLQNVTVIEAAISATSGMTTISDGDAVSNTIGEGTIAVKAITLSSLLASEEIKAIDLLKVNIEGAEGPLMEAMSPTVAAQVRHAVISCHDFRAGTSDPEDWYRTGATVDANLERLGFTVAMRPHDPRPWVRDYRYATPRSGQAPR